MSLIQIQRQHQFGLGTARNAAHAWMAHAEKKYGAKCRYVTGRDHDVVYFSRPQADGHVRVGAQAFEFYMQLGWILAPFTPSIEEAVQRNFDALLLAKPKRLGGSVAQPMPRK